MRRVGVGGVRGTTAGETFDRGARDPEAPDLALRLMPLPEDEPPTPRETEARDLALRLARLREDELPTPREEVATLLLFGARAERALAPRDTSRLLTRLFEPVPADFFLATQNPHHLTLTINLNSHSINHSTTIGPSGRPPTKCRCR